MIGSAPRYTKPDPLPTYPDGYRELMTGTIRQLFHLKEKHEKTLRNPYSTDLAARRARSSLRMVETAKNALILQRLNHRTADNHERLAHAARGKK